jgi:hypothetical protein
VLAFFFFRHASGKDSGDEITPETPRTSLTISLTDVYGEALANPARVRVCHPALAACLNLETTEKETTANDLPAGLKKPYSIVVVADGYNDFSDNVFIEQKKAASLQARMEMDTDDVTHIVFKDYRALPAPWQSFLERSSHVAGHEGLQGERLYNALAPAEKAVVLNIMAKSAATVLADGSNILESLGQIVTIEAERIITKASPAMQQKAEANIAPSQAFYKRSPFTSGFHVTPAGYKKVGSYKTHDAKGNLDIELYENRDGFLAEIDIDEDEGLAHWKEVVRNTIKGKYTNPVTVSQILAEYQDIDTLYRPSISKKTKANSSNNAPVAIPPRLR